MQGLAWLEWNVLESGLRHEVREAYGSLVNCGKDVCFSSVKFSLQPLGPRNQPLLESSDPKS